MRTDACAIEARLNWEHARDQGRMSILSIRVETDKTKKKRRSLEYIPIKCRISYTQPHTSKLEVSSVQLHSLESTAKVWPGKMTSFQSTAFLVQSYTCHAKDIQNPLITPGNPPCTLVLRNQTQCMFCVPAVNQHAQHQPHLSPQK
jgi:hypothetical protein